MNNLCILTVFSCAVAASTLASMQAPQKEPSFRVRSDFAAPLNSDQGWGGALNEPVAVDADRPFRVRFEVERAQRSGDTRQFRLQYRRNGGDWTNIEAHDFPKPDDAGKTPRVSVVACAAFENGAATTNLLAGSASAFQAGAGVALADRTPRWAAAGGHGEFEWALVVRRFADGAVTNDQGDTFELRMIDANGGGPVQSPPARLRLNVPARHLGGTFVETPGRIGPWQAANGDLYFIMEPAETSNLFMMVKSTDNGLTWREVDAANRPPTNDLEAVDSRQAGATIHILHEVSRSARYHSFRTSDHPTHPDSWDVRGELVTRVEPVAQAAALEVRSDGSLVAFYVGPTKIHYSIRSPSGTWSAQTVIDANLAPNLAGPQAVLGAGDIVHLAYYGTDGTIWYRRLLPDGTLTARQQLASGAGTTRAEYGSVLPLVYLPDTNTVIVIYRLASGHLFERRIMNGRPPTPAVQVTDRDVITDAVDSQQPAADAVRDGQAIHVAFVERASRSLFSTHDRGGWQPSMLRIDGIRGSWIRGNVYTRPDGVKVYGYVYDAGSEGGAGMNRFAEVELGRR
jgi:hypothetical protein